MKIYMQHCLFTEVSRK